MEYLISQTEISRRKKAYATLSVSLIIGLVLASIIFDFPISVIGFIPVIGTIFLIGIFSFISFHYLLQTKILLSRQSLVRARNQVREEYSLAKINRVKIKRTTNKTIREIYIWLSGGKSVFITALDHFEQFEKELLGMLDKDIAIEEIHEPIDYDHPLFYSILGLIISSIGVLTIKLIANFNAQSMHILALAFFVYALTLGIYFIVGKPISKRFGVKTKIADYLTGAFMICSGIIILIIFS
jgi:hypothetical protein